MSRHGRWRDPGAVDVVVTHFDLDFGPSFWALLPPFLLVAVIATIRTISGVVAIQRMSWRRARAVDFRAVQGAITVDGLGNLRSGLAGTTPNTATTVGASVTELTGVGARSVGVAAGAIFLAVAFLPKVLAVVLAIPGPVFAAYLGVLLATLFAIGMKMAVQDGIDYRKGLVVGVAFWIGVGFQNDLVFPEHVSWDGCGDGSGGGAGAGWWRGDMTVSRGW